MNESGLIDDELLEASRLSEIGEDAEALELLLRLEPDHPDHATLLCMIGVLASQLGADGMAGDFFRRCLAQNPTDPELLVAAGAGLARSADAAAEGALRLAALSAPDLPPARMHYGAFLVRNGLVEQGLEQLEAARNLDPGPEVRKQLGIAYVIAGRNREAIAELEAASPEDPDARFLLALALIRDADVSSAAEELLPLAEEFAFDGDVQIVLALAFMAEGWEEEAWLSLSRAEAAEIARDPGLVREVEGAFELGPEASRQLLFDAVGPAVLSDRLAVG
ncbi:MAG: hypothetical protein GEU90_02645 [Gemmatimonas sp.]|nr:hypothetical protein [Gemmatimonas sp.]